MEISIKGLQDRALDGISSVAASTSIYNIKPCFDIDWKGWIAKMSLQYKKVTCCSVSVDELSKQCKSSYYIWIEERNPDNFWSIKIMNQKINYVYRIAIWW